MIRKRKAEFQKTERDIEDRLADAEKKTADDRASSSETNDNDSQVDAKYQGQYFEFFLWNDRQKFYSLREAFQRLRS